MLLRRLGFRSIAPFVACGSGGIAPTIGAAAPPLLTSSFALNAINNNTSLAGMGSSSNTSAVAITTRVAMRFQSGGVGGGAVDASTAKLLEEIMMLTSTPIPIGTLFKSLSMESRQTLMKMKLPLETFLLRHKDTFSVYKNAEKGQIMASRVTDVPISAMRGVEATPEQMFTGRSQEANLHAVYTVLKYIPNEWSPFVSLGIPEEIRVKFMNKKPKAFFEAHPKYFEVKAQALRAHTFEVRRSLELQKATAAQQQQQQQ